MPSSSAVLNTALIGLGMVADTHTKAIAALPEKVRLRGVYARGQSAAQQYAQKASQICDYSCDTYPSIEAVAADPHLDFVIIATPPSARMEIVQLFCEAKKPMLMEKPLERTTAAAVEIVERCEAAQLPLGVVFQHRARAASQKLAQLMQSGKLGQLGMANVTAPLWRAQSYYDEPGRGSYARDGGGVLMVQGIHTLDLMLSLTGAVSEVQAMSETTRFHRMEAEDFVTAGLRFESGAVGSLLATTANYPGGTECIQLHFDQAVANLDRGRLDIHWRDNRVQTFGENNTNSDPAEPMNFGANWHAGVIEDFVDALQTQRSPMATGRESLKVHRLMDALTASSAQGRVIAVHT